MSKADTLISIGWLWINVFMMGATIGQSGVHWLLPFGLAVVGLYEARNLYRAVHREEKP